MKNSLRFELTQEQLEALASGEVLVFDQAHTELHLSADVKAVNAFKAHVYTAMLLHLNPSNQSIQ